MSCFQKPDRPSRFAPNSIFFSRHNLHSVKIGNLRSVSHVPFRFHSIVLVQRQHGKTSAQVNNVVVFFLPMYVSETGTLGNVQILSQALLHSPNIKVNFAIQYLQLVFLKSQTTNTLDVALFGELFVCITNNMMPGVHLFSPTYWL